MINKDRRIYIAGHKGMVGSAIHRRLKREGFENIVTRSHADLDLTDQHAVRRFFNDSDIHQVVLAAARVGGIHANNAFPAEFIYQNLMIQTNVIHAAFEAGIEDLIFLGSSCIYPKKASQPMQEEALLGGWLEPTNEPYAIAKIAGIKMCESYNRQYGTHYRSLMPTNLYGPNDNYDLETSHVLPAFIRKCHLAKLAEQKDWTAIEEDERHYGRIPDDFREALGLPPQGVSAKNVENLAPQLILWGTGQPFREFLHVDDLASACFFVMHQPASALEKVCRATIPDANGDDRPNLRPETFLLNIGTGDDLTIRALAELVQDIVGFKGAIVWDDARPDGSPKKQLDVSRMSQLGWRPTISLREGIASTYRTYLETLNR